MLVKEIKPSREQGNSSEGESEGTWTGACLRVSDPKWWSWEGRKTPPREERCRCPFAAFFTFCRHSSPSVSRWCHLLCVWRTERVGWLLGSEPQLTHFCSVQIGSERPLCCLDSCSCTGSSALPAADPRLLPGCPPTFFLSFSEMVPSQEWLEKWLQTIYIKKILMHDFLFMNCKWPNFS